jgi:hypothetical protein
VTSEDLPRTGGIVVGALVDKAIGNQLIYAPWRPSSIYVTPTVSPPRLGLTARVSF